VTATATVPEQKAASRFTLKQRLMLGIISTVGAALIRLIGPTLRFTVSIEEGGPESWDAHPAIYVFWHRCVITSCWWWRHTGIRVMTSSSFDGEYIARIVEKFGYKAVRGSSTRGAVRALLGMHREIEAGYSVAFTIDGPKGPMNVAKPGPVLLARNTQLPIVPFYIAVKEAWVLNSWDRFVIPKPFSRAVLRISKVIRVPEETDSRAAEALHAEMQAGLERATAEAEAQVGLTASR